MTEEELRALVRAAVARHLGVSPSPPATGTGAPLLWPVNHPSFGRYALAPTADGACLIEPAVRCNHCGYCQSHGY